MPETIKDRLSEIERLKQQLRSWNVAASSEICPGSEFVDDPKRVFAHVRTRLETSKQFALENASLKLRLEAAEEDGAGHKLRAESAEYFIELQKTAIDAARQEPNNG